MFEDLLARPAVEVAPLLLGAVIRHGSVAVRLTEVEAYLGAEDPGSHAFRGQTPRNAVMFSGPGRLYTYFSYGMHVCANVVCGPEGTASGVLLRAGRVIDGAATARARRTTSKGDRDLARGPARLTVALGITLDHGGTDLGHGPVHLEPGDGVAEYLAGPRTGVSGVGGGADYPWRFWIPGDDSVSAYRRHTPARGARSVTTGRRPPS